MSTENPSTSVENEEIGGAVLEYIARIYKSLANDYLTPDGRFAESCSLVAVDVAELLINEGKIPELIAVRGKQINSRAIIANETLKPLRYEGRVGWGGHTICVWNEIAFDPMIGTPVPLSEYAQTAFGTEVEYRQIVGADEIEVFVGRAVKIRSKAQ